MRLVESKSPKVGIIGMGWVGRTYANNFSKRGIEVICYSLEPEFKANKELIKSCEIVIIAVPTPTKGGRQDDSILRNVVALVGSGNIAVIKSTITPGTTSAIQTENPEIIVMHSPEFLSLASAEYDAQHPKRNIIGLTNMDTRHKEAAELLLSIIPKAPFTKICNASEAELIKYAHNCGGYLRIVFHNILYNVAQNLGVDWEQIKESMAADPNNLIAYLDPVHNNGRGAGGPCFIKDYSAFCSYYETFGDPIGSEMLYAIERKNLSLLEESGKDLDIVSSVYSSIPTMG